MCYAHDRYNEKTDVHSFAVVLWELVTGWLPYAGLSPDQFMFQAVRVNWKLDLAAAVEAAAIVSWYTHVLLLFDSNPPLFRVTRHSYSYDSSGRR